MMNKQGLNIIILPLKFIRGKQVFGLFRMYGFSGTIDWKIKHIGYISKSKLT